MSLGGFEGLRILISGHTGFKGTWLTHTLHYLGARVHGLSLPLSAANEFFIDSNASLKLESSHFQDIRDFQLLERTLEDIEPDYIFHFAAQSIVSNGYDDPLNTISTNLLGTANLLSISLKQQSIKGITIAATDKVYRQLREAKAFVESDALGGLDPYSASKAATEIIIDSFRHSSNPHNIPVSSVRAGNVVGGGDFGNNRLVPDILRSLNNSQPMLVRNLKATRPWQYVTDAILGYLSVAKLHLQGNNDCLGDAYNIGPSDSISVSRVIEIFSEVFSQSIVTQQLDKLFSETEKLSLNSEKAIRELEWTPRFSPESAIYETANWYFALKANDDIESLIAETIKRGIL